MFQIKCCDRFRIPDTQSIYHIVAVTDDGEIVGDGTNSLIIFLFVMRAALFIVFNVCITTETNFFCIFFTADFKRIAILQPVIRNFLLVTVFNFLFEHTVFVTNTASICRISQRCQRIQEACSQTAQTAVTQSVVSFGIFNHIQIQSQFFQSRFYNFGSLQVDDVIAKCTAHQEFHGQVVYHFGILLIICFLGSHPLFNDCFFQCICNCIENLLLACIVNGFSVKVFQIVLDFSFESFFIQGCTHS